ncbi:reverse transcriptase domain-containing protein [Tanacetum coccineum]
MNVTTTAASNRGASEAKVGERKDRVTDALNDVRVAIEQGIVPGFLALGWHLQEIHVTWAHLKKKRTRLRLYTIYLEESCIQSVETSSHA